MKWNHRILAHKDGDGVFFKIHEVYYDEKENPCSYASNGVNVSAESIKDIKWVLNRMKDCIKKPILSAENFPNKYNLV